MKLYEYRAFPNPRRVRIFLAEKGVSVETVQVNVPAGEHRQEAFRALNPDATVPCLALDDGRVISGCVAISRYLEAKHPNNPLMGRTADEQGLVAMWQRRVEAGLMDACGTYFHHATPGLGALELYQNADWGRHNGERAKQTQLMLDAELANRDYIAGDFFSIADITALAAVDFARFARLTPDQPTPNLDRWHATVSARPSAAA